MSERQARIAWGSLLGGLVGLCVFISIGIAQNKNDVAVEKLLPANTVLYFNWDGNAAHRDAWEKTAAYEALEESGLLDAVRKFFSGLQPENMPAEAKATGEMINQAAEWIMDNGMSATLSLPDPAGPPIPVLTVVFRNGSQLSDGLAKAADMIAKNTHESDVAFGKKTVQSRNVTTATISTDFGFPIEIGWWVEGEHLVLVAGLNAVESGVNVAAGGAANLSTNGVWKKQTAARVDFEQTTVGWLDFKLLRDRFAGMPLPPMGPDSPQHTVNDVLKVLGLDTLETFVCKSGYKGRAMWSQIRVDAPGPKRGLLALADQKPITMADLPPLPFGTNGFYAASFDWSKLYDEVVGIAKDVAQFGPPDASAQVDNAIMAIPQMLGFDLKTELFDPLGNVVCVYGDTRQGFLGMGSGIVLKVDDPEKLRGTIDKILDRITATARGDVKFIRAKKQGREIIVLEVKDTFSGGGLVIDKNWMAIGILPQTVEAFLLRLDGKLTVWHPTTSYQQGLDALPKEFTSIASMDPRKSYRAIIGLAPILLNVAMGGLKEVHVIPRNAKAPISVADIPPAEQVSRPLFPNLTVSTVDDHGFQCTSRTSLPGIPFLDTGIGGSSSVATAGVLVALLLPAVQRAREAAQRMQSKNNLKQIGLALHNYHATFNTFPEGTAPNDKLEPDKRLSWIAKILPFLDQMALYDSVDFKKSWNDAANEPAAMAVIKTLQNPGARQKPSQYGTTHYVGIAGVGKDAPTLPMKDNRVGAFGYNRATRIRDITDGTSNTMGVTEASDNYGPWAAGGRPTLRALTTKPYINGPDGIGGPFHGGLNVMMLDGSVRFVSENIDPKVLEAMSTIHGGERVRIP